MYYSQRANTRQVASFYASIPDDGPQLGNADTRKVFQNNFFSDFQKILQPGSVIKKFEKCDFGPIKAHLEQQRAIKKVNNA
jgi:DNA topoisomerase-1